MSQLIVLGIGLAIMLLILSQILPTSLGTFANSSQGNAMKNVDAGTKSLYNQIPLFSVIAIIVAIVGGIIYVIRK